MAKKNPHVKPLGSLTSPPGLSARQSVIIKQAAAKNKAAALPARLSSMKAKPGSNADQAFSRTSVAGQPTWKAPTSTFRPSREGSSFTPGSKGDTAYTGVKSKKPAAFSPTTTASDLVQPKRVPKRLGTNPVGMLVTGAAHTAMGLYDKHRAKKKGK